MTFVFLDEENDMAVGTVNSAQVYLCIFGLMAHRQMETSPSTRISATANVATKILEQLQTSASGREMTPKKEAISCGVTRYCMLPDRLVSTRCHAFAMLEL